MGLQSTEISRMRKKEIAPRSPQDESVRLAANKIDPPQDGFAVANN